MFNNNHAVAGVIMKLMIILCAFVCGADISVHIESKLYSNRSTDHLMTQHTQHTQASHTYTVAMCTAASCYVPPRSPECYVVCGGFVDRWTFTRQRDAIKIACFSMCFDCLIECEEVRMHVCVRSEHASMICVTDIESKLMIIYF